MKKLTIAALALVMLTACGPKVTTGTAETQLDSSKITCEVTLEDGKVTEITIDETQGDSTKRTLGDNYGMKGSDDKSLTYVQNGLLAAILLNSGAADFVVTGCGTGMGAMLALNSFPRVSCGLIIDPSDAFMFGQINDGNAISLPYAKGFGWGAEVNLTYIFEKLFTGERGLGYPRERRKNDQKSACR